MTVGGLICVRFRTAIFGVTTPGKKKKKIGNHVGFEEVVGVVGGRLGQGAEEAVQALSGGLRVGTEGPALPGAGGGAGRRFGRPAGHRRLAEQRLDGRRPHHVLGAAAPLLLLETAAAGTGRRRRHPHRRRRRRRRLPRRPFGDPAPRDQS